VKTFITFIKGSTIYITLHKKEDYKKNNYVLPQQKGFYTKEEL
jgi:hypothetical protein